MREVRWPQALVTLALQVIVGLAVLLSSGLRASSEELFGITKCCPNQFVTIDLSTGTVTPVSTVGDSAARFAHGAATVDPNGKRFFVAKRFPARIMTIDLESGTPAESPSLSSEIVALGYNANSEKLMGITACCPNQFVEIDPTAGTLVSLGTVGNAASALVGGAAAVDAEGNRFFLAKRSPPRVVTINTQTGTPVESPTLSEELIALGYDSSTASLIGVTKCCPSEFVQANLTTGNLASLGTVGDATARIAAGAIAVDSASGSLYLARRSPPSMLALDTQTPAVAEYEMPAQDLLSLGSAPCPPGCTLWVKRFGDEEDEKGWAVAVDSSGDVVVLGNFSGTVNFGGSTFTDAADDWTHDLFLAKFSGADGSHLWSKHFGDINNDKGWAVGVDTSGDVLITGVVNGTVDFGDGPLSGGTFVAKFSGTDGSYIWSKIFAGGDLFGLAVDSNGNAVVTGSFAGTVNFGGGALTSAGQQDIVVAKFSGANGAHLWSKRYGLAQFEEGRAIAVDSSGNVLVAGYLGSDGGANFGGGLLTPPPLGSSTFVAKLSAASAAHLWSKSFDTNWIPNVAIATDVSGNVLVTGQFQDRVNFGGGMLFSSGITDIFVAKFSGANGSHLWSERFGGSSTSPNVGGDAGVSIVADASNDIVVVGEFLGTADFGGGPLTSAGEDDIFVVKFSGADQSHLWSKRFGSTFNEYILAFNPGLGSNQHLAVDSDGNIVVTGGFRDTVDFGSVSLTSAGSMDIFVLKLKP